MAAATNASPSAAAAQVVARERPKAPAAQSRVAPPPTGQTGKVQLAVSPWGYVEVDGKPVGASPPLQQLTLPEGTHSITIRNADFLPYTTSIRVTADKAASVRHRFTQ